MSTFKHPLFYVSFLFTTIALSIAPYAQAATLPIYPDCSGTVSLPADWQTQVQAQVTADGGGTINNTWTIMAVQDDFNPNQQSIYFYLTPNNAQATTTASIWLTQNTDVRKYTLNVASARGVVYRPYYNKISGWNYSYSYTVASNTNVTRTLQCGSFNRNTVFPGNASYIPVYQHSNQFPVAQDAAKNWGFIDPVTTSSGSSSSTPGLTKTELQQTLVQFSALLLALWVGSKLIGLFRYRI